MPPMITTRLQLASRIQLLLFRELGEKIAIDRLLTNDMYARDVLLVCEALRNDELVDLAHRFRKASPAHGKPGREPQAASWSDNTSGFGLPPLPENLPDEMSESDADAADEPPRRGWLAATRRWLRL
jgi:hypothetical protein